MFLLCIPGPHVALHGPHSLHIQFKGHDFWIQFLLVLVPHFLPPKRAGCSIILVCFPRPHSASQLLHGLQLQTTKSSYISYICCELSLFRASHNIHILLAHTLYNTILRIARNLLETRENIKIESHIG